MSRLSVQRTEAKEKAAAAIAEAAGAKEAVAAMTEAAKAKEKTAAATVKAASAYMEPTTAKEQVARGQWRQKRRQQRPFQ